MDKFGLSDNTIEILIDYFSKNKSIEKVLIFGSRAKGVYHNGSDIDFAILGHDDSMVILQELEELPLPYKFNVVSYENISHANFKKEIDDFGMIFYNKK